MVIKIYFHSANLPRKVVSSLEPIYSRKFEKKKRARFASEDLIVLASKYNIEILDASNKQKLKTKKKISSLRSFTHVDYKDSFIAVGFSNGTISIYYIDGRKVANIKVSDAPIKMVSLDPPYIIAYSDSLYVIDIEKKHTISVKNLRPFRISADSGRLALVDINVRRISKTKEGIVFFKKHYVYSVSSSVSIYNYLTWEKIANKNYNFLVHTPKFKDDLVIIPVGGLKIHREVTWWKQIILGNKRGIVRPEDVGCNFLEFFDMKNQKRSRIDLPYIPYDVAPGNILLSIALGGYAVGVRDGNFIKYNTDRLTLFVDLSPSENYLLASGEALYIFKLKFSKPKFSLAVLELEEKRSKIGPKELSKLSEYLNIFPERPVSTLLKASKEGIIIELLRLLINNELLTQEGPYEFSSKYPAETLQGLKIIE